MIWIYFLACGALLACAAAMLDMRARIRTLESVSDPLAVYLADPTNLRWWDKALILLPFLKITLRWWDKAWDKALILLPFLKITPRKTPLSMSTARMNDYLDEDEESVVKQYCQLLPKREKDKPVVLGARPPAATIQKASEEAKN